MAQQTLLTMVQTVLSSLGSDEVNSISDTVESSQVAQILQQKYYDIIARGGLTKHQQLFQLNPSIDATKPTLMYVPQGVQRIEWVKYFDTNVLDGATTQVSQFGSYSHDLNIDLVQNPLWTTTSFTSQTVRTGNLTFTVASTSIPAVIGQGVVVTATGGTATLNGTLASYSGTTMVLNITSTTGTGTFASWNIQGGGGNVAAPGYLYVTMLPIDQFLEFVNRFNPTDSDVGSFQFNEGGNNFTFYYKNSHQPRYCTIISNQYVVFDMYDKTQDTTLQASKTLVFGQVVPLFIMQDNFIPQLDDQEFPLLVNEAKALAFLELKQMPHPKADLEVRRQWNVVGKYKSVQKPRYFDRLPNFGRVPRTGGFSGGGYGAYKWMRQSGP